MTMNAALDELSALCGILPDYYDLHGTQRITPPETQKAMLSANGIDVSSEGAIAASLAALRHDRDDRWFPDEIIIESNCEAPQPFGLGAQWTVCPDGSQDIIASGTPRDFITVPPLPSGIYVLTATASCRTETITVLAVPKRLPSIEALTGQSRLWGITLSLYGVRSDRNSGLGDFEDLARVAQAAAQQGASFLGINPLHNMGFSDNIAISPYSSSHRGFLNTAYIALDKIPGLAGTNTDGFCDLRAGPTVPYHDHKPAHHAALEAAFVDFTTSAPQKAQAAFGDFKKRSAAGLQDFARFEALGEIHGCDWRQWPQKTQPPAKARLDFHMWLQWLADVQLTAAQARATASGMPIGLYLNLAVGSRRDGAEAWCEQSVVASGVSIGAPPDHLSPQGQNWNLTALSPIKLKKQRYRAFRRIIGQMIRHAGLIRIDHVLGLNRSFWIPDDGSPGAYMRQPFESLLAVIKIEAEQYNCAVVGEDLGLVPEGFRDTMRGHGFYGYSVLQYEKEPDGSFRDPHALPAQVLSCFATHDTPTVKGYEIGRDIDWWQRLDWIDGPAADTLRDQRSREVEAFNGGGEFHENIHARLAYSPAALVAVQLDDIEASPESQNLPGTIDAHPNWQRRYSGTVETLPMNTEFVSIGETMQKAGRSRDNKGARHANQDR